MEDSMNWKGRLREPLVRLLVTALTIAVLALLTRQLRLFIEDEAMSVFEESAGSADNARPTLYLEVEGAAPVSHVLGPTKRVSQDSVFSSQRLWLCTPAAELKTATPAAPEAPPLSI